MSMLHFLSHPHGPFLFNASQWESFRGGVRGLIDHLSATFVRVCAGVPDISSMSASIFFSIQ